MYTLFIIFMTLMLSSGIIVWLISIFNQKIKLNLLNILKKNLKKLIKKTSKNQKFKTKLKHKLKLIMIV